MTGRPRAASVMPRSTYTMETSNESSYAVDDSIHRAEYFSNAVLEDTYNQAVSSRGKDVELLRNANATIAFTDYPLVPRSTHRSRRMRASSVPPRNLSVQSPRRRVKISSPAQEGVYYRPLVETEGLRASNPPIKLQSTPSSNLPKRTEIRKVEITYPYSKPNLLSWEHRLESRVNPSDIIYEPASYGRIRQQVRDVKDKMDRTRQLHDRYLDPSQMTTNTRRHLDNTVKGSTILPDYYACGGDPMHPPVSELRRKLRRTVCRSKGQPNYYRLKDNASLDQ